MKWSIFIHWLKNVYLLPLFLGNHTAYFMPRDLFIQRGFCFLSKAQGISRKTFLLESSPIAMNLLCVTIIILVRTSVQENTISKPCAKRSRMSEFILSTFRIFRNPFSCGSHRVIEPTESNENEPFTPSFFDLNKF